MRRLFETPNDIWLWITCIGIAVTMLAVAGATYAAFVSRTTNSGNSFAAATDFAPPDVTRSLIAKVGGYNAGSIKQAGSYYVYAQVTDSGNPPSGVSLVRANVAQAGNVISTGKSSVTMCSGSWTVEGQTYNYRSTNTTCGAGTSLTANNPLSAGSKNYSITATDNQSQSATPTFTAAVDNTVPAATNLSSADGGGTVGKAELGDTVTFNFSEPIDSGSILSGWDGGATAAVVRIDNRVTCAGTNLRDCLRVYDSSNTTQLALGEVDLVRNYVAANRTFGATGTPSTIERVGNDIIVTLGTASGATRTVTNNTQFAWAPSTAAFDFAGNNLPAGNVTQTPAAKEF